MSALAMCAVAAPVGLLGGMARGPHVAAASVARQAAPTSAGPTSAPPSTPSLGAITGSKTTVTSPPVTSPPVTSPPVQSAATAATAATARTAAVGPPTPARRIAALAAVAAVAAATTVADSTTVAPVVSSSGPAPAAAVASTEVAPTSTATAVDVVSTSVVQVGDPEATRTVRSIAWALLAMAVLLGGLMVWFWRLTRPVPVALGGLVVMGTSRWRRSPKQVQDDLVSSVRAEPLALGSAPGALADADEIAAVLDPDLAPLVPATPLDASFEWPPAASAEEIAALAPQYRWARPVRRTEVVGPPAVAEQTGPASDLVPTPATAVESPTGTVAIPIPIPIPVSSPTADDEAIPDLFADATVVAPLATTPIAQSAAQPLPPPLPSPSLAPTPSDGSTERNEDDGR